MTNKPDALPVVANPSGDLAEQLIGQLIASGAENYLESHFDLVIDGNDQPYSVMVSINMPGKPTPHELRTKAEAELSELRTISDAASNALHAKCKEVVALQAELAAMQKERDKYANELIAISDGVDFWHGGKPPHPYGSESFIAVLKDGSKAVLRELDEENAHDYTTADGTYYTADWVVRWAQFPDSNYLLYAAPVSAPSQVAAEVDCGHAACKSLGEPHPFCEFVTAQDKVAAEVVQVPRELAVELLAELPPKNPVSKALRALLATSQGKA